MSTWRSDPRATGGRSRTPRSSRPPSRLSGPTRRRRSWSATRSSTTSRGHERSGCARSCSTETGSSLASLTGSPICGRSPPPCICPQIQGSPGGASRHSWLRAGPCDTYPDRALTDRSISPGATTEQRPARDRQAASEEKRRLIIDAAVRVFARDGYHTSRVGDIAEEAGIAHGLLYHYFPSKEAVLATLFRENWGELLGRFQRVEESDEPADEQLRGIAKILRRTWRNDPHLVRVMVREVARSSHLQEQVDDIEMGFATIQRVIERGQAQGVFRADLDPRLASWIFYGGLEEILTGWVLGQLPDGDEEVARAERTIIDVVCGGLTVRGDAGR